MLIAVEQFNGREQETTTLLSRRLFTLSLRGCFSAHVNSTVDASCLKRRNLLSDTF